MHIPFSPPDITAEEVRVVTEALLSGWITTGPKTKELERLVARRCGTEYAVCLNSQTACSEMTLRLLGVGPGDEVITTAYTYTKSAAEMIDGDKIAGYVETGEKDEYYYEVLHFLNAFRLNTDIQYFYVFVPCEEDLVYIWDANALKADETEMERVMTAIKAVRNRRAEMNVPPSKKAKIFIETAYENTFSEGANFFVRLASASDVEIVKGYENDEAVAIITEDARLFIPLDELVDFKAELERLEKEKAGVLKEIAFVSGKLNNEKFVAKAPEALVNEQREKLAKYNEKLAMLEESIAKIANK